MLSLNPYGKVLTEVLLPKEQSVYKEVCLCKPPIHWNVIFQERRGKEVVREETIVQTFEEKLADYVIDIVCDEGLSIDFTL